MSLKRGRGGDLSNREFKKFQNFDDTNYENDCRFLSLSQECNFYRVFAGP